MGALLLVIGAGLFRPTIILQIGDLYPRFDPRRNVAFFVFNLLALIASFAGLIYAKLSQNLGWKFAFGATAFFSGISFVFYHFSRLKSESRKQEPFRKLEWKQVSIVLGAFLLVVIYQTLRGLFAKGMNVNQICPTCDWLAAFDFFVEIGLITGFLWFFVRQGEKEAP